MTVPEMLFATSINGVYVQLQMLETIVDIHVKDYRVAPIPIVWLLIKKQNVCVLPDLLAQPIESVVVWMMMNANILHRFVRKAHFV